jgi:DNA-binding NarL/FixJ family response regulator
MENGMIKVLLADDHPVVRDILLYLLEKEATFEVVATAGDGKEAVTEAEVHCPDVVVMDVSMPVMDGIEAARNLQKRYPEMRVLMVSSFTETQYVREAIEAGASGYVIKDRAARELAKAVQAVFQDRTYFSRPIREAAQTYLK